MRVDVRRPRNYRHRPFPLLDTFTDAEIRDMYWFRRDSIAFICDTVNDDLRRPTHVHCLWKRRFSQVCDPLQVDVSTKWMQCLVPSTAFANLSCRRKIVSCVFLSVHRCREKWEKTQVLPNGWFSLVHIVYWLCIDSFVHRKGFHSINVQAMTDADYKFADIVARWPGSTHGSFIFRTSDVHDYLRDNHTTLEHGVVLGDSGYSLANFLMIPYTNPTSHQQRQFNTSHKTIRSSVERSIEQLKGALNSWKEHWTVERSIGQLKGAFDSWKEHWTVERSIRQLKGALDSWKEHWTVERSTRQLKGALDSWNEHWTVERSIRQLKGAFDSWKEHWTVERSIRQLKGALDSWKEHWTVERSIGQLKGALDSWKEHWTVESWSIRQLKGAVRQLKGALDSWKEHWTVERSTRQLKGALDSWKEHWKEHWTVERSIRQLKGAFDSWNEHWTVERNIGQLKGALDSWKDGSFVYSRAFVFNQRLNAEWRRLRRRWWRRFRMPPSWCRTRLIRWKVVQYQRLYLEPHVIRNMHWTVERSIGQLKGAFDSWKEYYNIMLSLYLDGGSFVRIFECRPWQLI